MTQEQTTQVHVAKENARLVLADAFDLSHNEAPKSIQEAEVAFIAAGIAEMCNPNNLAIKTPEQLQNFILWNLELYATRVPRDMSISSRGDTVTGSNPSVSR